MVDINNRTREIMLEQWIYQCDASIRFYEYLLAITPKDPENLHKRNGFEIMLDFNKTKREEYKRMQIDESIVRMNNQRRFAREWTTIYDEKPLRIR